VGHHIEHQSSNRGRWVVLHRDCVEGEVQVEQNWHTGPVGMVAEERYRESMGGDGLQEELTGLLILIEVVRLPFSDPGPRGGASLSR
jgi:hypothetical protein